MGQGQRSRSTVWRAAVDIRGLALPSAAKSNRSHYQFKVFVCVSLISGRMRIIVRMRSIGVLIYCIKVPVVVRPDAEKLLQNICRLLSLECEMMCLPLTLKMFCFSLWSNVLKI